MTESSAGSPPRSIRLSEILALVLLWNCGYKGVRVLNTLYALELGAGPFDIGLLLATYGLFALVLAIYAGRSADRYGVRMPIGAGLVCTIAGIALPFFWPSLAAIFISAAISGTGFIFVQVGMQTLVGSLAGGMARTKNINSYALTVSVADFLGPVVAGFLIDHSGYVSTYLWLAALGTPAVLGVALLRHKFPPGRGKHAQQAKRRAIDLLRLPELRRVFISSTIVLTGVDLFQLYLPLYGRDVGLSASAIGLVLGAFAVAGFVTRVLMPAMVRRLGEQQTLIVSLALSAATFLLIPLFSNAYALGAICFVLGLGMGLGQPLTVLLTYNYSPAGRAGEAIGLRVALNNAMHVVVPTVFGGLGSVLGIAPIFWISSAVLGTAAYITRPKAA